MVLSLNEDSFQLQKYKSTKGKPMKTKFKSTIRAACQPFGAPVCAGALLLMAASAPAQNLFVANLGAHQSGTTITEITPGGAQSTFASGLSSPEKLAFDSAGDLFEADTGSGNIYKFTSGGVQSTFATGLSIPVGLAFDGAGNLFVTDWGRSSISSK